MALPFLIGAGLVAQGASSLFGIGKGIQAMNQSRKINPDYYALNDPRLQGQESEYAKQMLGQAQMALNARSPYAAAQQRGILGSQAGAMASAQRSVTDPSQILAVTAALQGGTNRSLFEQGAQEQEAYQRSLSNLMGTQQLMISERDKLQQEKMNKYLLDQQRKDALQQAGAQSVMGGLSNLASAAFSAQGIKNETVPNRIPPISPAQQMANFNTQASLLGYQAMNSIRNSMPQLKSLFKIP